MSLILAATIATIALALLFDFTNGFHDSANATSTVIATRSLTPYKAVALATVFNFLPAFIVGTAVANTVAKVVDLVEMQQISEGMVPYGIRVVLAALIGAIFWNFFTWHRGLPSSSSHALIGGLVGAGIAAGGTAIVNWDSVRNIGIALVASPLAALVLAALAVVVIRGIQRVFDLDEDHVVFQGGQIASSAWVAWAHGANDAQKTMGIVAAVLVSGGYMDVSANGDIHLPWWVVFGAYAAIAGGTFYGGWSIVETLGLKITRVTRATGIAANVGAVATILGATQVGVPVSTTQTVSGSIVGSGIGARRPVAYRVVRDMLVAWLLTAPAAAAIGWLIFHLTTLPRGLSDVATAGAIVLLLAYAVYLMRTAVTEEDLAEELPSMESLAVAGD
ncbi:MAG: inorganic phosphate transporter [Gaiellales bacterium]